MWFYLFLTVQQLTTQKIQAVTFWLDSCGRAARQANRGSDGRMPEVACCCLQNKSEHFAFGGALVEWVNGLFCQMQTNNTNAVAGSETLKF